MEPTQQYFDAPDLEGGGSHRISFLDWGKPESENVLICVHGLTRNAHDFDYLARALADDYRVIAIDMAGRGDSDRMSDPLQYHYGTYMTDCIKLLDNFHLRGVDWLGTSMGGIVGMMIAAMHPGRIKRLVLNDIGAFIPKQALGRIADYVKSAPESFATREDAEANLRIMAASFGIRSDEHWQHLFRYSIKPRDDGRFAYAFDPDILASMRRDTHDFTDIQPVDLSELWTGISIPTLMLRGAESDVLERETVSAMRAKNLKCQVVEFAGVGHAPALLEEDQIQAVTRWLRNPAAAQVMRIAGA